MSTSATNARPSVVDQRPECEERYLDERRCPDCHLFCHLFCQRIGTGGPCPNCDEPVAITDLTDLTDLTEETTMTPN